MGESNHQIRAMEWLDEDRCLSGSSPGLFYGGCHGDDEQDAYAELCEINAEVVAAHLEDGRPLPPPTANRGLVRRGLEAA